MSPAIKCLRLPFVLLLLAAATVHAQYAPKVVRVDAPKNVAFVGNSFTAAFLPNVAWETAKDFYKR